MNKITIFAAMILVAGLGMISTARASDAVKAADTKGVLIDLKYDGYGDGAHFKIANGLIKGYRTGNAHTSADRVLGVRCTYKGIVGAWSYSIISGGVLYHYVVYPNATWTVYNQYGAYQNSGTWSYAVADAKGGAESTK